jgi:hypothetical protein
MKITQLTTLAKTTVGAKDFLLTANPVNSVNQKLMVADLFPTLANSTSTSSTSLLSAVSNKNEYTLSRIVAGSTKLTVSGGGGTNDVSIDLGTLSFSHLTGTISNAQLAGAIDLTTKVKGTLPIKSGGTGSTATAYCNLISNVSGTLAVANGGTNLTSFTADRLFYASSSSVIGQLSAGTNGTFLMGATGTTPVWGTLTSTDGSVAISQSTGNLNLSVVSIPTFSSDVTWTTGSDRYIKPANSAAVNADKLYVEAGSATSGNGGDLYLKGGLTTTSGSTAGKVILSTGTGSNTISDIIFRQNVDASNTRDVLKIVGNKVGITNTNAAFTPEESPLHVVNADTGTNIPPIHVEQDDTDGSFILFKGTVASGASTASLATSTATASAKYGAIKVAINDKSSTVHKWIRVYDTAI